MGTRGSKRSIQKQNRQLIQCRGVAEEWLQGNASSHSPGTRGELQGTAVMPAVKALVKAEEEAPSHTGANWHEMGDFRVNDPSPGTTGLEKI